MIEIQAMTRTHPEVPNANVRDVFGRSARNLDDYLPDLVQAIDKALGATLKPVVAWSAGHLRPEAEQCGRALRIRFVRDLPVRE